MRSRLAPFKNNTDPVLSDEDFSDPNNDMGSGCDMPVRAQEWCMPTEVYPKDDITFYQWAQNRQSRRMLVLTAFFHVLGAAAHGSAMVITLFWSRMDIYINLLRQEVYAVDHPNASHPWDRRDVFFLRWHPSWVIFVFFALSFFFHLLEGASLLSFLCFAGIRSIVDQHSESDVEIVSSDIGRWNGWYVLSLYRCCAPTRWLEYFFSASLQVMNLAALTAITDFSRVLMVGALMATTQLFGLLQEVYSMELIVVPRRTDDRISLRRLWAPGTLRLRLCFWALGFVPYTVCWYVLVDQIERNIQAADMGNGVFLRVLLASQLMSFTGFAFVQLANILHPHGPEWYPIGEMVYVILSFTAKALFGVIAIQESLGPNGKYDELSFFVVPN